MMRISRTGTALLGAALSSQSALALTQPSGPPPTQPSRLTWADLDQRSQHLLRQHARYYIRLPDGRFCDGWGYDQYLTALSRSMHRVAIKSRTRGYGFVTTKTVGHKIETRKTRQAIAWGVYQPETRVYQPGSALEAFYRRTFLKAYWQTPSLPLSSDTSPASAPPLWGCSEPGQTAIVIDEKQIDKFSKMSRWHMTQLRPGVEPGSFRATQPGPVGKSWQSWPQTLWPDASATVTKGKRSAVRVVCDPKELDDNGHFKKPTVLTVIGHDVVFTRGVRGEERRSEYVALPPRSGLDYDPSATVNTESSRAGGWKVREYVIVYETHLLRDLAVTTEQLLEAVQDGKTRLYEWSFTVHDGVAAWRRDEIQLKKRETPAPVPSRSTTPKKKLVEHVATHVVYLTDGRVLSGELLSENESEIQFLLIVGGITHEMTIARHEIERIEKPPPTA